MIPDPPSRIPFVGGSGNPAGERAVPRPGQTCWLCGQAVEDPPRIIGHWKATQSRVAHRHCLDVLGRLDLHIPFPNRP